MTAAEDRDQRKLEAAERALELVRPGMNLGLGSGSTAHRFVDLVGERVKAGLQIRCVATSEATAAQARALGVSLATLDEIPELDLTVDGADEIDFRAQTDQGRRRCAAARKDRRRGVEADGRHRRRQQAGRAARRLSPADRGRSVRPRRDTAPHRTRVRGLGLAGTIRLRGGSSPFLTDSGHHILDCSLGAIANPEQLSQILSPIPGVVEHGLFIGLARAAIVAGPEGVEVLGDPD